MKGKILRLQYQCRDPPVVILDFIEEVRPPEYSPLLYLYLTGQKKCLKDIIAIAVTMIFKFQKTYNSMYIKRPESIAKVN